MACRTKAFKVVVSKRKFWVVIKALYVVYVCCLAVPACSLALLALVVVSAKDMFALVLPGCRLVEPTAPLTAAGVEFHANRPK